MRKEWTILEGFTAGEHCAAACVEANEPPAFSQQSPAMHFLKLCFLAAAILAGAGVSFRGGLLAADEATPPLTIQSARVGIGNRCKAGYWAPVWLDLVAGAAGFRGELELIVADGDNVPVVYGDEDAGPFELPAHETLTVLRYAKIGPEAAPIRVQLRVNGQVAWGEELVTLPARLAASQEVIVGVGHDLDLPNAVALFRRPAEQALVAVQAQPQDLPDRWWGYEGIDTVVLTTSDPASLADFSPKQRDALLQWNLLGGRIIVSVGSRGEELSATSSPWSGLLPGKLTEVSPLRERTGLETMAGTELPWEEEEFTRNRPLVTRLAEFDGQVLVDEVGGNDRPLVIRAARGLGEVIIVGIDLDHPGLAKWPGRSRLMANLLASSHGRADEEQSEPRRGVTHLGYEDLTGQLRAALDQFPGVALVNFTTVAVLTIVYLLLIGPGDFLLLNWLQLPRQTTWLTFGLVACGLAVAAWYLGREAHGDRSRVNQVELIDIDAKTGIVRGTVWTHLYTAVTSRFTAAPETQAELLKVDRQGSLASWQGLPGNASGGLGSRQIALAPIDPYRISPPNEPQLASLPIQCASSKSLSVRWWGRTTDPIESLLVRNEFGALEGELTNPLPMDLSECLVAYEDRLYRLGTLQAGQSIDLGSLSPLHLEARLTERTIAGSKDVSTPWDQHSTDVPRIVQMLMFHEAARGRSYTGLTHRYQSYIDLSGHVRLSRAVLAGRTQVSPTRWTSGGRPLVDESTARAATWCRIVLPVSLPPSDSRSALDSEPISP
jgi:hypothetical protein